MIESAAEAVCSISIPAARASPLFDACRSSRQSPVSSLLWTVSDQPRISKGSAPPLAVSHLGSRDARETAAENSRTEEARRNTTALLAKPEVRQKSLGLEVVCRKIPRPVLGVTPGCAGTDFLVPRSYSPKAHVNDRVPSLVDASPHFQRPRSRSIKNTRGYRSSSRPKVDWSVWCQTIVPRTRGGHGRGTCEHTHPDELNSGFGEKFFIPCLCSFLGYWCFHGENKSQL